MTTNSFELGQRVETFDGAFGEILTVPFTDGGERRQMVRLDGGVVASFMVEDLKPKGPTDARGKYRA